MVARSAILIMATVDAIMTGWSGARELAYLGLGVAPMIALLIISIGALQSTMVLVSQAIGAGERQAVGDIWRASLIHALAIGSAAVALWALIRGGRPLQELASRYLPRLGTPGVSRIVDNLRPRSGRRPPFRGSRLR